MTAFRKGSNHWSNLDADLTRADLTGAAFVDANITGAKLIEAELTGTRFQDTNWADSHCLRKIGFTRCNEHYLEFKGAQLR